jgi:membrane associated rhomboid family serine protease
MSDVSDDLRVVFESLYFGDCNDRALVLAAAGIPHQIVRDTTGCALVVPAENSAAAMKELRLYDDENPPARPKARPEVPHFDAMPGVYGYFLMVCLVAWLAGTGAFGEDWLRAGRVDGTLIRSGEWWRLLTALTLHADVSHLVGNLVFGTVFGLFAGRLLGSGVGWLAIVVAAASGNLLNTLLLESAHRSIGASTAVFAALGIVAGYVWRARLMSQERWPYRLGPVIGGFALLMYTGSGGGDGNTDVGAHLLGFLCGFAGGTVLTRAVALFQSARVQWVSGFAAIMLIAIAWIAAFISERADAIM